MGLHTTLLTSLSLIFRSGGADFIFIPERPPEGDPWEDEMCNAIKQVTAFYYIATF